MIKKICLNVLIVFIFMATAQNAYCKAIQKQIEVQTKDGRILKASLSYTKIDGVKKYSTVVLLHSLGYSSENWGSLISDLNSAGYAVIAVDFRGHGKSIFNSKFQKRAWTYFDTKTYQKFPNDVIAILNQVQKQYKMVSFDQYAIIGADIGANTAVMVAKDFNKKPKALVLISATTKFKGIYIPLAIVDIGGIPILSIASKTDKYSLEEQQKLAKFSQGGFYAMNYPNGGMGMLMIKVNPTMSQDITRWIIKKVK